MARAVADVSSKLATGLDKRIEQLDQRAEARDRERRDEASRAAEEAAEIQAKRFTELLTSIAQNLRWFLRQRRKRETPKIRKTYVNGNFPAP